MVTKFENKIIKMEIIDDIMHATYKKGMKITLPDAQNIVNERINLLGGKILPTIVFDGGVVRLDKAARDFFSSDEGTQGIKCVAIVQSSMFSKMLVNFFLKITKPKIKVKAFDNSKDAITWLNTQKSNSF
ncbi:MAG: STAS/SEC14 domain-containing protein [Bacteroidota bacterium]|nr:STAS/SEC14 domain-containing protein [Bacteroidota bacterium]